MADLERFVRAQDRSGVYLTAIAELTAGAKRSHWMWFVFPQIAGLGTSDTARHYAIADRSEAEAFLAHPVLGPRLRECVQLVADSTVPDARDLLGGTDAMKLRSSVTLFQAVDPDEPMYQRVLDRYFDGRPDPATLERLG